MPKGTELTAIRRSAALMSLATTLSRVLGYLRDSVSAHLFGANWVSDAFVVAFRLPNLFRDLFAEGALSSAFVPVLVRSQQKDPAQAWQFAALMINALAMALGVLVLAGISLAPWLLRLAAPGLTVDPATYSLALSLTKLLFPFIAFMGFAALFMGMLNARREFLLPALAPAMMNVAMIAFGLWVCPLLGSDPVDQMQGWAWGALVGGAAQWLVQVPAARALGFRWKLAWPWKDSGVRSVLRAMGPAVLGQSTTQINLLVNTMLASQLVAGSVTYLYYGNRLMQLPLGVFGVAIASAVLPNLAQHHGAGDKQRFRATLSYGLRLSLFISLPAAAGLIALALPIHVLLFRSGHFSLADAEATAWASVAYTAGVVFACWTKVLVPAFYAIERPRLPVLVSVVGVLLNLGLNLLLWRRMGYLGLATTASVVALMQSLVLLFLLRRYSGPILTKEDRPQILAMVGATLGMLAVLAAAALLLTQWRPGWHLGPSGRWALGLWVGVLIGLGALSYGWLSLRLGLAELIPQRLLPRRWSQVREVAKASETPYDEG